MLSVDMYTRALLWMFVFSAILFALALQKNLMTPKWI